MTDMVFIIGVASALVAVASSIARHRVIAMTAILVAGGSVILDRYDKPQPPSDSSEAIRVGFHGNPVAWSTLYLNSAAAPQARTNLNISSLSIMGINVSDEEIKLDEAYFLGGLDGTKLAAQIGRGGMRYRISDTGPLPPGAVFFIVSDPLGAADTGLGQNEFLKTWPMIYFVAKYNGTMQKIEFDRQTVESALSELAKP